MNRFVKTILMAGALTLSVGFSSFAASSVKDLANEISSDPGTFYTLYVGMPQAEYHSNWDGLSGWTVKEEQIDPRVPTVFSGHTREIKLDGKKAMERVLVTYTPDGSLYYITYQLLSNDVGTLVEFYKYVYDNCAKNYAGFAQNVKFDCVPRKGPGHGMKLDNGTTVTLTSFQFTPKKNQKMKYKYYVSLVYEESDSYGPSFF